MRSMTQLPRSAASRPMKLVKKSSRERRSRRSASGMRPRQLRAEEARGGAVQIGPGCPYARDLDAEVRVAERGSVVGGDGGQHLVVVLEQREHGLGRGGRRGPGEKGRA